MPAMPTTAAPPAHTSTTTRRTTPNASRPAPVAVGDQVPPAAGRYQRRLPPQSAPAPNGADPPIGADANEHGAGCLHPSNGRDSAKHADGPTRGWRRRVPTRRRAPTHLAWGGERGRPPAGHAGSHPPKAPPNRVPHDRRRAVRRPPCLTPDRDRQPLSRPHPRTRTRWPVRDVGSCHTRRVCRRATDRTRHAGVDPARAAPTGGGRRTGHGRLAAAAAAVAGTRGRGWTRSHLPARRAGVRRRESEAEAIPPGPARSRTRRSSLWCGRCAAAGPPPPHPPPIGSKPPRTATFSPPRGCRPPPAAAAATILLRLGSHVLHSWSRHRAVVGAVVEEETGRRPLFQWRDPTRQPRLLGRPNNQKGAADGAKAKCGGGGAMAEAGQRTMQRCGRVFFWRRICGGSHARADTRRFLVHPVHGARLQIFRLGSYWPMSRG